MEGQEAHRYFLARFVSVCPGTAQRGVMDGWPVQHPHLSLWHSSQKSSLCRFDQAGLDLTSLQHLQGLCQCLAGLPTEILVVCVWLYPSLLRLVTTDPPPVSERSLAVTLPSLGGLCASPARLQDLSFPSWKSRAGGSRAAGCLGVPARAGWAQAARAAAASAVCIHCPKGALLARVRPALPRPRGGSSRPGMEN